MFRDKKPRTNNSKHPTLLARAWLRTPLVWTWCFLLLHIMSDIRIIDSNFSMTPQPATGTSKWVEGCKLDSCLVTTQSSRNRTCDNHLYVTGNQGVLSSEPQKHSVSGVKLSWGGLRFGLRLLTMLSSPFLKAWDSIPNTFYNSIFFVRSFLFRYWNHVFNLCIFWS